MYRTVVCLALVVGCGSADPGDGDADAGVDGGPDYPAPRTDLVPSVGTDATLDLATWNIENFPLNPATPALVADLVASLDLDIVAVQEIEDLDAWQELLDRLPEHDGVISTHTYSNGTFQKVGFLYKADVVSLSEPTLLFENMGYEFPRPPLSVTVTADDLDFVLITLHLKAGRGDEDRQRRTDAVVALEQHIADTVAGVDPEVVVVGDYNEVVTSTGGRAVFDPFLDQPAAYTLATDELATEGRFTFVPSHSMLDHMVRTASVPEGTVVIPPLDVQLLGYENGVSDHLPVVMSL